MIECGCNETWEPECDRAYIEYSAMKEAYRAMLQSVLDEAGEKE
jgi:hypothetical protein